MYACLCKHPPLPAPLASRPRLQLLQRRHDGFDGRVDVGPVLVVEVDVGGAEARQRLAELRKRRHGEVVIQAKRGLQKAMERHRAMHARSSRPLKLRVMYDSRKADIGLKPVAFCQD